MTRFALAAFVIGFGSLAASTLAGKDDPGKEFSEVTRPTLNKYCGKCHGGTDGPGGLGLANFNTAADVVKGKEMWARVQGAISQSIMPPPGQPDLSDIERKRVVKNIHDLLAPDCDVKDPGRVTMRRLNRAEYDNTVRDLLGIDLKLSADFPSDDVGYGFDNNGDVLSLSPLLMEKYLASAERIADAAIYLPGKRTYKVAPEDIDAPNSNVQAGAGRLLFATSTLNIPFRVRATGSYILRVKAYQTKAGSENAKMAISVDGKPIQVVDVSAERGQPQTCEINVAIRGMEPKVGLSFVNDFYKADTKEDRNLGIAAVELEGPLGEPSQLPTSHRAIITERPIGKDWKSAERSIFRPLASRAFRRPVTGAELEKLISIAELGHSNGESFERSIQLGLTAVLVSPAFLFRVETPAANGRLDDYALASRLSYFLWSSMPDQTLFDLAAAGKLRNPTELQRQAKRMLLDTRAKALADNFASQWLQYRKIVDPSVDKTQYLGLKPELRKAMATETEMFFADVVSEDRPITDFLASQYSFLNAPLAAYYGVPGVQGEEFRRVDLAGQNRSGVLTQGSVLTVTSNPTRTSPVKRGKWILENILNAPTPPPPPSVGVLKDDGKSVSLATVRERLEEHRKDPACATCHKQMDGLGFALENFDSIGRWRTKEGSLPIDAHGELPNGSKFEGPIQLRDLLLSRKDEFVRCLAVKLATYGLGRGMELPDNCNIEEVVRKTKAGQYRFSELVAAIVTSDAFLKKTQEKK